MFSFNITKDKVSFLKGEVAKELFTETSKFKEDLLARKNIQKTSKKLFDYLLNQQLNWLNKKLLIIPDNILNYIPFEVLISDKDNYLINDFTISYSGSVRLFLELKNNFFNYATPNYWAGFSPSYSGDQKITSSLNEVSEIAEIVNGEKFIGEDSNINSFLNNNTDFSILHLAMHTEIDNNNPMFNKLVFSDGELSASEIYLSKNRANLAVLSSCQTGFGKLEKGEGVISMARAFHFSGVPSVIMSLWKVPDKETKKIMVSFYKHLNKGESKSEALKNAKLDYIESTDDRSLKHPFYWSGFVLNGNTKMLKSSSKNYYLIGAGLIIVALFLVKKRNKQS